MGSIRESNLKVLKEKGYGVEELGSGQIDLYDDNKFLFVEQFRNHKELAKWIEENIK